MHSNVVYDIVSNVYPNRFGSTRQPVFLLRKAESGDKNELVLPGEFLMIWFVYNLVFALVYPFILPHYLLRMYRRGGYRKGFLQRLAFYDKNTTAALRARRRIWIHAVSVGEVFVALRLMKEIRQRRADASFVLTTTTSTGHTMATERLDRKDVLLYFPVDFPPVVHRVFSILNPEALILIESEIWPNLVRTARQRGVPVIMANGRISGKSYNGYRKLRGLVRKVLAMFDLMLVQGKTDASRLETLGADPSRIKVLGSAKYDDARGLAENTASADQLLERAGILPDSLVIVAGSTWPGEEEIMLDLLHRVRKEFHSAKLVLVPRHVERTPQIIPVLERSGFRFQRRSLVENSRNSGPLDVLLVDTTGELKMFYASATVTFVGKSLVGKGGQNVIEAAAFGNPVVVGPDMQNFKPVMEDLLSGDAIIQVRNSDGLVKETLKLLRDPDLRDQYGKRAVSVIESRSGIAARSAELILDITERARERDIKE